MMHGFSSTDGAEVMAYVPKAAINADLKSFTTPAYEHRYMVDGELTVASAYLSGAWKTVLVGTMGRSSSPGVFALDVTDPNNIIRLWDKSASDIAALGNNLGKPIIAQVADNDWRVVFGNGANSASGTAKLITIKLDAGTATSVDLGGTANGLTAATVWDSDSDGFFDRAYAGDMLGNMWRIDGLANTTPTTIKLFSAVDSGGTAQPITAAPLVAIQPTTTTIWIFFGTGRYLGTGDVGSTTDQTWYGIKDGGATISGRSALVQRSITDETTDVTGGPVGRVISSGTAADLVGKSGWYIDLISPVNGHQGERMVVPNIFLGLALVGVTRITNSTDPCSPGGTGFVMAIDPFTGARLDREFFDRNGDGVVDGSDTLTESSSGDSVIGSGLALSTGSNGVIAVGDQLYGTLDNGGQLNLPPAPPPQTATRVNWHEVIGN
jgi:type IV pilus assembly protein PilY1